jgi:hypothetical protein
MIAAQRAAVKRKNSLCSHVTAVLQQIQVTARVQQSQRFYPDVRSFMLYQDLPFTSNKHR